MDPIEYLHDQAQKHPEVRDMLAAIESRQPLSDLPPGEVEALAEAVMLMNDEAPIYDTMSVDDQRDITEIL